MDRNEFMELVYETFADEPDNVLANGIIEAADAYAEHEKAQLSQQGTTSDLISRMETVEHLRRVLDATVPITDYDEGYVDGVEFGISTVSTMPTIQPERKKGEWLPDNNNAYEMRFVCSCCKESEVVPTIGFTKYKTLWDFCPNCGADMRGEKDE
jgi:hypothetical protein